MSLRRRVEVIEEAAGVGRAVWLHMAATGQRAALEAVRAEGGDAGQVAAVRRAFQVFRQGYTPGASAGQMMGAADRALDRLRDNLPRPVYVRVLAHLSVSP